MTGCSVSAWYRFMQYVPFAVSLTACRIFHADPAEMDIIANPVTSSGYSIMKNYAITTVMCGALLLCLLTVLPLAGHTASKGLEVVNNIGAATENAVDYVDDGMVTAQVKAKFVTVKGLDSLDISVTTENGVVSLNGMVDNEAQISLAASEALTVNGVKRVINNLKLRK